MRVAVEEFDAADGPLAAAQVNGARLAAGGNPVPDFDLFIRAVRVMNHYSVKLDRAARDAKLNALKSALVSAYADSVAIPRAGDRRLSEIGPGSGSSDDVQPVERHSRHGTPRPVRYAVAEIDATDGPFAAAQVDGARLASGGDPIPDFDLFTRAVRVVDHYALKLDRGA